MLPSTFNRTEIYRQFIENNENYISKFINMTLAPSGPSGPAKPKLEKNDNSTYRHRQVIISGNGILGARVSVVLILREILGTVY